MKRIIALIGLLGAFAASADSYLYWMVDGSEIDTTKYSYDTVKVAAKDSAGTVSYMSLLYGDGSSAGASVSKTTSSSYSAAGLGFYASLLTSPDTYTYAIELFNGSTYVAQSETGWVDYGDLASYVVSSPMQAPLAPWAPGSYGAVPEPSSALLTLLGCALLGLKRKKFRA